VDHRSRCPGARSAAATILLTSLDGKTIVTTNAIHVSDEIWLLEPAQKR
jgi:hypothetical protein